MKPTPEINRIVCFNVYDAIRKEWTHRPGVIVENRHSPLTIQLQVMLDGTNDVNLRRYEDDQLPEFKVEELLRGIAWRVGVELFDEKIHGPHQKGGKWSWPAGTKGL